MPVSPLQTPYPGPWRVIVVGGGHAGCEAALACTRLGVPTLLLTQNIDRIGWMSCNPSIGGIGKSHLVAEIDALGGEMARNTDRAGVHYKWLNDSRGPAVRALRAQCDKLAYATAMRQVVEQQPGLHIKQGTVASLVLEGERVRGVVTQSGLCLRAEAVVLTAGTFLDAVLHTGLSQESGGRAGDGPSVGIGGQLRALGVRTLRHKTGTCPRVDSRSIDWSQLEPDPGLTPPPPMSPHSANVLLPQMICHLAHTNATTHAHILGGLDRSPLFSGVIEGTGPRYCPSIEDKVVRFGHHDRHYLFLEREGWSTTEVYVSGLSTSLPADVQLQMVRSIKGLQAAEIVRFGYAVEYDAIDARQLQRDLSLPAVQGLYLAGQVNGTSGYEEAAAQGLVAGLNAAQRVLDREPVIFSRQQGYLGVLVDDLVTQGNSEPYRMFTSRAEHRLELRCTNADLRLTPVGRRLGLVGDDQWRHFEARGERMARARDALQSTIVRPARDDLVRIEALGAGSLTAPATLAQLLCRSGVEWDGIAHWLPAAIRDDVALDGRDTVELTTEVRYAGYVRREQARQARTGRYEHWAIPADFDYGALGGLSREAREHLEQARPETLGQATRVPGVTPAAVQVLAFALRQLSPAKEAQPPR